MDTGQVCSALDAFSNMCLHTLVHTLTTHTHTHTHTHTLQGAWNGLPVALRLTSVAHSALFLSSLKTTLFDRGWAGSAPE